MSTKRHPTPAIPSYEVRGHIAKTRPFARHQNNPSGSKLLRRFAKARTGERMKYDEARLYYASLDEPKYRQGNDPKRTRDALHAYVAALQARAA